MKTSSVRKRLVSPWIVGMPTFVFLFHIIKEGYTARMLHFWNPPSPFVQGKGASVPRVLHLGMSCPPEPVCSRQGVLSRRCEFHTYHPGVYLPADPISKG